MSRPNRRLDLSRLVRRRPYERTCAMTSMVVSFPSPCTLPRSILKRRARAKYNSAWMRGVPEQDHGLQSSEQGKHCNSTQRGMIQFIRYMSEPVILPQGGPPLLSNSVTAPRKMRRESHSRPRLPGRGPSRSVHRVLLLLGSRSWRAFPVGFIEGTRRQRRMRPFGKFARGGYTTISVPGRSGERKLL